MKRIEKKKKNERGEELGLTFLHRQSSFLTAQLNTVMSVCHSCLAFSLSFRTHFEIYMNI